MGQNEDKKHPELPKTRGVGDACHGNTYLGKKTGRSDWLVGGYLDKN
jgi:hypothetical protein